jgi:hypothetical protein
MMHYGIAHWVDFARGLVRETDQAAMREHLASGCSECGQLVNFCDKLASDCREMARRDVPESAVRLAHAIFPINGPPEPKRAARTPVELIFDSFLMPSPAGLRASWQVGWQALYRAGDCSVDLRVEPELSSSRAAVIGQIFNHVAPEVEMADIPICLKQGRLVLAKARSNRFGEFQMEYEQQRRMQLCIYLDGSKCIQVPIKRLATDKRPGVGGVNLGVPAGRRRSGPVGR